ncbi:blue light receptor [Nowakowskiella sp. JEL0078]|nr:blue light receptor [Nowakowskiella sp. JEL0078]
MLPFSQQNHTRPNAKPDFALPNLTLPDLDPLNPLNPLSDQPFIPITDTFNWDIFNPGAVLNDSSSRNLLSNSPPNPIFSTFSRANLEPSQKYIQQLPNTSQIPKVSPQNSTPDSQEFSSPTHSESRSTKSALTRHTSALVSNFKSSERILSTLADFVHVFSPKGILQYCSPSVTSILGYQPADLIGSNVSELLDSNDRMLLVENINRIGCSEDESFILYLRYKRQQGGVCVMEVSGRPIFSSNSSEGLRKLESFLLSARDCRSGEKKSSSIDTILQYVVQNSIMKNELNSIMNAKQELDPQQMMMPAGNLAGAEPSKPDDLLPSQTSAVLTKPRVESSRSRNSKKKKQPLDLFCHQCGIRSSPEWRRGPKGPKTLVDLISFSQQILTYNSRLCNACGLSLQKQQKKLKVQQQHNALNDSDPSQSH